MCDYQQRYPTHVSDVAQVCLAMAERHAGGGGVGGVWHWSGNECFTKYAMACTMAELFDLPTSHLVPVRSEPAQGTVRPYDCKLESSATAKTFPIHQTPFREGIASVLKPFVKK